MDCPRCNDEMTLLEGEDVSLQRCTECSGVFIDPSDLNRILLRNALPVLDRVGGRVNLEEISVTCPECDVDMTVIEGDDKRGLKYEACESCGGIWIDLDEADDQEMAPVEAAIVDLFREMKG